MVQSDTLQTQELWFCTGVIWEDKQYYTQRVIGHRWYSGNHLSRTRKHIQYTRHMIREHARNMPTQRLFCSNSRYKGDLAKRRSGRDDNKHGKIKNITALWVHFINVHTSLMGAYVITKSHKQSLSLPYLIYFFSLSIHLTAPPPHIYTHAH